MDNKLKLKELNPLFTAAERGDSIAVNLCVKSGFNVNEKVNGKTAADLAWNNQHFDIVLDLLKANSQFPRDFKAEMATDGIGEFIGVNNKLHAVILEESTVEIGTILQDNPDQRHFYSIQNISAPAFALISNKFKVYEFLIANNVYIGPDENVDEIYMNLNQNKCRDLKKIHLKYLKSFKDSHLIVLAMNSQIDGEPEDTADKLELIRNAYKFLDQADPFMSLILQIVAASRDFKVIFDFNSSVTEIKVNKEVNKVREFRVQAQGLLDPVQQLSVHESMAREFCIYAMELVYKNYGRPYTSTDDQTRKIFNKISTICEESRGKEELIDSLYSNKAEMYHAKLMALVPQMMVKYSGDPVRMDECRENFSELFKFCQDVVKPEMQHKLPTIKSSTEQTAQSIQISNKRQLKLLVALILAIPFSIWLTLLLTKPYIEPIYSCRNITDELRLKVFESTVEFQGVNVIFGDLFGRNSTACEHLSPQEITRMLKVFDSGKIVENNTGFYENFTAEESKLFHQRPFRDFTERLGFGYMRKINYEELRKEKLNQNDAEYIYVKYMKTKFKEPALKIDKKVELRTKFYIDRWTKFHKFDNKQGNFSKALYLMGFNEIKQLKVLLLSDKGGSGKSTYFRHMAWKLKRRFPLKWISYVDLKQHIHVLHDVPKTDANLTTVVDFLSSKLLNLTSKLEIGVFERKFLSNQSVFLWDGVDEVSPTYLNEILRLVEAVRRLTDNKQWMSTRPYLEKQIVGKFNVQSHVLEEFVDRDKHKFIQLFLETNGIKTQNLSKVNAEIDEFLIKMNTRIVDIKSYPEIDTNPQILYIVCEAYARELQLTAKTNLYTIFDNYFTKSFEDVVMTKGEIVQKDFFKVTELGMFKKYHQHLAAWSEVSVPFENIITAEYFLMNKNKDISNPIKAVNAEEVMRFGIVHKYKNSTIFEHQIFKEFFLAQYFMSNIWENPLQANPRDEVADNNLNFLFYVLRRCITKHKIVCDFINGFVEAYSDTLGGTEFNPIIKRLLIANYPDLMDFIGDSSHTIDTTVKFFKKDHDVISVLWKINQNRTHFHEFFEKTTSADDVADLKKILDDNFNLEDRKKILEGKHQAANFLRISWQKCRNRNSTAAFMDAVNFKFDIERLRKVTKFEKFMELLEAQNYTREELLEFFAVSVNSRVVKTDKDVKVFQEFAKKLLNADDFSRISKNLEQ